MNKLPYINKTGVMSPCSLSLASFYKHRLVHHQYGGDATLVLRVHSKLQQVDCYDNTWGTLRIAQ